jgi:hypothetical protein
MIDTDLPDASPARRIGIVARTLRPLQSEMRTLQERLALLSARKLFAARRQGPEDIGEDLAQCAALLTRMRGELDIAIATLPIKSRADSRLVDARVALDRAEDTVSALSGQRPSA